MSFLAVLKALQHRGAERAEGFSSPFEVNFGLFFWTWVVFIILFFVLKRFAWPPILRAAEGRERTIERQLREAERQNTEARELLEQHREMLANAKQEGHALVQNAKDVGEKESARLLAKARGEQEQIVERAKRDIEAERDRAIADLRREAVDVSLAAAAKLIGQRLDGAADRKLVEDYLASLAERR